MSNLGGQIRLAGCVGLLGLVVACTTYEASLLGQPGTDRGGSAISGGSAGETGAAGAGPNSGTAGVSTGATGGKASDVGGAGAGSTSGSGGAPVSGAASDAEGGVGGMATEPLPTGDGSITHERWWDVPGSAMTDFPSDAPDETIALTQFKAPGTEAIDYADRISGYLVPPLDGNYRFWIACDDNCELWLSTDDTSENEVLIASLLGVDRWSDVDEWGKFASQESRLIPLEAGKRYRIEALVKQGIGGSNLSVGWLKPGQSGTAPSEVIPGSQLSP